MSTKHNQQVVQHFIEEVINGDQAERAAELTAPSYALHFPGRSSPVDQADLQQFALEMQIAFPDWHVQIENLAAEGDDVIVRSTVTGTHRGVFQGIPATGKRVSFRGLDLFRLRDGKIVEQRTIFDRMAMLEQLGLMRERRAA
jgi:steroid delta-isomerase-like uncharacterized protein